MADDERGTNPVLELSQLIESTGADLESGAMVKLARAILAAGYRKPRIVTTEDELDALPVGSVIRTAGDPDLYDPRVAVKTAWWSSIKQSDWAVADTDDWEVTSDELDDLPATVLHVGGTE